METYINKINYITELLNKNKMQLAEEKLQELKNTIIYDVAIKKCNRNTTKKDQLVSAKELLKNSKKVNEGRILFHKIYKYDDTFQMCDGFTVVVLKNMIDGLELNTADGEYLDCRRFINRCNVNSQYEEVKIDRLDIEQKAVAVKKMKFVTIPLEYQVHIKNSYYNPIYLSRAIKILATKDITAYANTVDNEEPLYLKSELGEAILLPLREVKEVKNNG